MRGMGFIGWVVSIAALAHGEAIAAPGPQVSFTFDDGPRSNYTVAAPILARYGFTATAYITTSCIGKTRVPNGCKADGDVPYMTWAQVKDLRDAFGWEIGAHSVSHPLMTELDATRLRAEVVNSKKTLRQKGFDPMSFATPYGDYDSAVMAEIAKHYTSHRPFHDTGYNHWPYADRLLRVQQVQAGVDVATVKGFVDEAAQNGAWLILVFHEVSQNPSADPADYQYGAADLAAIAAYVKAKDLSVVTVSEGLAAGAPDLLTDPATGNTLGGGWSTDAPAHVKVDKANKGAAPEPKRSLALTSSEDRNVHAFSPSVAVTPSRSYVIKGYVDLITAGEIGFYIDEFGADGTWLHGQLLQTVDQWHTKDASFVYTPSSPSVTTARLQIIVVKGAGVTAYVDSLRWFAM